MRATCPPSPRSDRLGPDQAPHQGAVRATAKGPEPTRFRAFAHCWAGYVQQNKTYSGRSPATYLALTPEGRVAFERYVRNLRALLDA